MDASHRLVLRQENPYLMDNLDISPRFLACLVSKRIIQNTDMERLMMEHLIRNDKAAIFLSLIETKGPNALPALLEALDENEQSFIRIYLEKAIARVDVTSSSWVHGETSTSQVEPIHHYVLKHNLMYLVDNLSVEAPLIANLLSTDTLNAEERENIKDEKDPKEKVITLYTILLTKPPGAYVALLNAVEATGQLAVLEKLLEFDFEARRNQEMAGKTLRSHTTTTNEGHRTATMDLQYQKDLLREEQFLMSHLSITLAFLGHLMMNLVISCEDKNLLLKAHLTKKQQALVLCNIVAGKGRDGFNGFLAALTTSGQDLVKSHVLRIFPALAESESQEPGQTLEAARGKRRAVGGEGYVLSLGAAEDLAAQLERLCMRGSDINSTDRDGWTGLHHAAGDGRTADLKILLRAGADIHARDKLGDTPLHWACGNGHHKTAEVLLGLGADVDARGRFGWTPLHVACWRGSPSTVPVLLQAGANKNIRNDDGRTPRDCARRFGHEAILKILPS